MLRVNQLTGFGHAVGYSARAAAYFAAMTAQPSAQRKNDIDAFCVSAKGVLDKFDLFYLLASHDSQAARLNLVNPGSNTMTVNGSPTFTTDRGYKPNAGTDYLDTGWDPANDGVNFTLNDACLFAYSRDNVRTNAASIWGQRYDAAGNNHSGINPWNASINSANHSLNSNEVNTIAPGNASGMFLINRTGSTSYAVYRENSLLGTQSTASVSLNATDYRALTMGGLDTANRREIAVCGCGASLTSGERTTFETAINTLQTAIGF